MSFPHSILSPTWRDGLFADSVVFCTGGAGTICSVQVKALVYLGANACIVGRNRKKTEAMAAEIAKLRPGALVLGIGDVDVRSFDSIEAAANRCVRELGRIDYVIAGAAGNFIAPISSLSPNGFKSVIEIDVIGSYNTLKATIPHLLVSVERAKKTDKGTGGRIIFVSATQHYTGMPMQSHVAAAKAGVDALSASVCIEYGHCGITSNVIAPGPIEGTEGMSRLLPAEVVANTDTSTNKVMSSIPAGRWGKASEIADGTIYLFSPAGNYVNGEVLVIDGGAWRTYSLALDAMSSGQSSVQKPKL